MTVWIHNIETMVPRTSYSQDYASSRMQEWQKDERTKRFIRAIYRKSGISKRHSVIENFYGGDEGSFFTPDGEGNMVEPSTAERNDIFASKSRELSVKLAEDVIDNSPGISRSQITHVITASCTGFYAPGPDYYIVKELGLSPQTQRYHLGFMGCYAAIPALRMAAQFCRADPGATVLVMCLEICSIHLHLSSDEDTLMANSLFADGAGAAVVSAREPEPGYGLFEMGDFNSSIVPEGLGDMAWKIGNLGFDMTLSSYVPRLIGDKIRQLIEPSIQRWDLKLEEVALWAVHPGGKAIIDRVEKSLGLSEGQVKASREILYQYGNMSSATIFFVLKEILQSGVKGPREEVCAITFGPGLTVEMVHLTALGTGQREYAL